MKGYGMIRRSAYYREREVFDRDRASAAELDNAKSIANRSADVWALEALRAERLEARSIEAQRLMTLQQVEHDLRQLSENPDRGYGSQADALPIIPSNEPHSGK